MVARVKMVCRICGSEEVLKDAFAEWDVASQQWVLASTYDANVCNSVACDGNSTEIDEVPICSHCNGEGDIDNGDHPCMKCGGSGLAENQGDDDEGTETAPA